MKSTRRIARAIPMDKPAPKPDARFKPHNSGVMDRTAVTGSVAGDIAAAEPKGRAPEKEGVKKSLYVNK